MIRTTLYTFMILSIAGGLLTLLGSVGIFISLIVQRRLGRLQDILEEFINLSYRSDINLTGQMYSLIEKYQMNYIFPQKPRFLILRYIDFNIFLVLLLWSVSFLMHYQPPFSPFVIIQLLPLFIGIYASFFFRRLLRNTIDLENPLLDSIIPSPVKLRSISYLSHFINLSVKSVLKQARLTLHLQSEKDDEQTVRVYLKEELSFDDFFYYLVIFEEERPCFVGFGEIRYHFLPDPITGKPVPACRNINVPLGEFSTSRDCKNTTAKFLIFTRGEKHPVQYFYQLRQGINFLASTGTPEITVNHQIVYSIKADRLMILACSVSLPYFHEFSPQFCLNGRRCFLDPNVQEQDLLSSLLTCEDEVFID